MTIVVHLIDLIFLVWTEPLRNKIVSAADVDEDDEAFMSMADRSSVETLERKGCLASAFPQSRSEFPTLLNCLGLINEAVEVGVQAGVHANSFLQNWHGRRLRLVDKWTAQANASVSQFFYVDIANVDGVSIRQRHREACEERLAKEIQAGRAELINSDSVAAAALIPDDTLDFVYLDARHDFAGVVADVFAWWPKVRKGGVFAGHDFVDGEFPEGDFFWISALREVLPGLEHATHVTGERNRYPSFFILKSHAVHGRVPKQITSPDGHAIKLYLEKSRYFSLWRTSGDKDEFLIACAKHCGKDCAERAQKFTPTRTAGSTLRPFACGDASGQPASSAHPMAKAAMAGAIGELEAEKNTPDVCAIEMVVDMEAYRAVCMERCSVTCEQRAELFKKLSGEMLSAAFSVNI